MMENKIKELVVQNSVAIFGCQIEENLIQFQQTRKDVEGDLTLVAFPFSKIMKCSPVEAGNKVGAFVTEHIAEIEKFEVINGFVNFILKDSYWIDILRMINSNDNYGFETPNSKPLMMVEYASPNTNKPLHLGHLRNIFLGDSVASILKANGHEVVKTQIINDRGIHICKSMLAWSKFSPCDAKGNRETPASTGLKGDKLVGKYYVEFDRHFNDEAKGIIQKWEQGDFSNTSESIAEEVQRLQISREGKDEKGVDGINAKIKDIAKNETALLKEAKEMLIKWEAKDPETYLLWSTMNGWVYEGFDVTYDSMGVKFDKLYYESDTFLIGKDLVLDGLRQGVFYKKEDGSIWVDLTEDGLDEKLLLRSDGTAVYMTQDIGTAYDRFRDYPSLGGVIYTVGNEQDYHFKVLFLVLQKLGFDWAQNCYHLSYGMVELPKGMGRMKSREGTVVDADDLMEEVVDTAREMTQERGHIEGMKEEEKNELFKLIGIGGLKYYLLKVDPKKRLVFNPLESIELTGNTGPFIQYAHARICSLLNRANAVDDINEVSLMSEEKELIKQLSLYPATIHEAATAYSPALIANYTYELVKLFNQFYQNISILNEEQEDLKNLRIALSNSVATVIRSSMGLLGINVPNRM